jgi:hypothetical protein
MSFSFCLKLCKAWLLLNVAYAFWAGMDGLGRSSILGLMGRTSKNTHPRPPRPQQPALRAGAYASYVSF